MNFSELRAQLRAFTKTMGHVDASVWVGISSEYGASVHIHPEGMSKPRIIHVHVPQTADLSDVMPLVEATWEEHRDTVRSEQIHAMALAIIEHAGPSGVCGDAALRVKFSQEAITWIGEDAVAEANRMAGRGPFSIARTEHNGAPAEEEAE